MSGTTVSYNGPIIKTVPSTAAPHLAVALAGLYPSEVRLPGARAIRNQQNVNCCVSCTLAVCVEVLHPEYEELSPLFHYFETGFRLRGHAPGIGDGIDIIDGLRALGSAGICLRSLHDPPYDAVGVSSVPSSSAEADGQQRAMPYLPNRYVDGYTSIDLTLDPVGECKKVLAQGCPILAGIYLTDNYNTGAPKLDRPGPRTGARHVVPILGYRDSEHSFIVQDSHGGDWALGGQWWLPYTCFFSPSALVFQAFAIGYPP